MSRISTSLLRNAWRQNVGVYTSRRWDWTSLGMETTKGHMRVEDEPDIPLWQYINGFRDVREHTWQWGKEYLQAIRDTSRLVVPPKHGDVLVEFSFQDPETIKKFQVTADSRHGIGFSKANLDMTKAGTVLFHGNLDTTVPKDGRVQRSGFAAMRCYRKQKAFFRADYFTDWTSFSHLLMKVRGDGRIYIITLGCPGFYDYEMADVFVYPLYTHGGPYWQFLKIPFSKFYLTCNGRIPERGQRPVIKRRRVIQPSHMISSVGVSLMDKVDGPFQLEIDWIGVYFDETTFEEWAYEEYKNPFPQ